MGEHTLGFEERRFLELYRRFYGSSYPAVGLNNQNAHVKGQKAVYLLMLKGIGVGDYGFTWQKHGPCSDELQKMMRDLDQAPKSVEKFYQDYPSNSQRDQELYSDDPGSLRLFYEQEAAKIDRVSQECSLPPESDEPDEQGDTAVRRWVELLGSLAYISTTRLPGAEGEQIWQELIRAESKKKYRSENMDEKERALRVLKAVQLLA